jgi:D-glycero-alpha-D-manno-heptose 1-phosphate guanylyltransferase
MNATLNVPAFLLVGGLGTRLRSLLSSTPKPLASVGNRLFLELLVRQLQSQGILRLVMCTGYLAEQVEKSFGDGRNWNLSIEYSKELRPLGTAGAVKLAAEHLGDSEDFLVMNGDSFTELDFRRLLKFHRQKAGLITMSVVRVENAARYGTVSLDSNSRVTGFLEKTSRLLPGWINAGVYVFNRKMLEHIGSTPASLEKDIFPRLLNYGVYAVAEHGIFIDIGTPEDYQRAQLLYERLYEAASSIPRCESPDRE